MSYRYNNAFVKPGLNTLVAPAPIYTFTGMWSWGYNGNGELGQNNTSYFTYPTQVGALTTWSSVAGSNSAMCAVKTDGTIWSCGDNSSGQLGLGNTTNRSSPVQIGALTNWSKVFKFTGNSSFAIKTDGTLWAWGYNGGYGQLGLGDTASKSSPNQVGSLTNWLKVSGGQYHALAIKTDGTLWSWGNNQFGKLGIGNTTNYSSPKQVGSLTNWLNIAAGIYHSLAIKTDGTLWAWGGNSAGQLGLGNTSNYYSSPKQVGALTTWSNVSAGGYFTCAVRSDGTIWAWGGNTNGCLGLNNSTSYSSPKQVGALTNWSTVSCGGQYVLSIKTDGSLWAWGNNGSGQLGIGTIFNAYSSPKQVSASPVWYSTACGNQSSYAIQY